MDVNKVDRPMAEPTYRTTKLLEMASKASTFPANEPLAETVYESTQALIAALGAVINELAEIRELLEKRLPERPQISN